MAATTMTLITNPTSAAYPSLEVVPEPNGSQPSEPRPGLILGMSERAVSAPITLPALRSVEVLANPGEFAELRRLLAERLPEQVGQRIELTVWGGAGGVAEAERGGNAERRADVVVLLLSTGVASLLEPAAGGVHRRFQRAVDLPTTSALAFCPGKRGERAGGGLVDEPLADLDLIVRSVDVELEKLDELQVAATVGLGDRLRSSASWRWRNDALSGLDRRMLGTPKRRASSEAGSGADQAANEWEQVCKAYEVESADFMRQHLARLLEITPLDGEARLWQTRLDLLDARSDEALLLVADDAATAAEIFERGGGSGTGGGGARRDVRSGYACLLRSKALRKVRSSPDLRSLHEEAYRASSLAVAQVGWHAESHLERAYTALLTGRRRQAEAELVEAFYRLPLSLGEARAELAAIPGGSELCEMVSSDMAAEAATDLRKMMRFGATLEESADGGGPDLTADPAADERCDSFLDFVAADPVRVAGAAQAMAVENLQRVRALSAVVVGAADRVEEAKVEHDRALDEGFRARPVIRGVLSATVMASVVLGIWMRSGAWFTRTLLFGLLAAAVAGVVVAVMNQSRARETKGEVVQRVGNLSELVRRFESVTTRYEAVHLQQRLYVPRHRWGRATGARETYRLERGVHPAESDDPVAPRIRVLLESEPEGLAAAGLAPFGLYSSVTGRTGRSRVDDAIRWLPYAPPRTG